MTISAFFLDTSAVSALLLRLPLRHIVLYHLQTKRFSIKYHHLCQCFPTFLYHGPSKKLFSKLWATPINWKAATKIYQTLLTALGLRTICSTTLNTFNVSKEVDFVQMHNVKWKAKFFHFILHKFSSSSSSLESHWSGDMEHHELHWQSVWWSYRNKYILNNCAKFLTSFGVYNEVH